MGKPLFFIIGLVAGLALAAILYLQASGIYSKARAGDKKAIANIEQAQTLWPPYMIDNHFQADLKSIKGNETVGSQVVIYLEENVSQEDAESLVNQLEVMDGVEDVQHNTLESPLEYINNMSRLPESKEDIRDHIVVIASQGYTGEVIEFAKLQEIVESVSTQ